MPEQRKAQYKNQGKDQDSLRKNRLETSVNLRKDKREETLSKRRNIPTASVDSDDASTSQVISPARENLDLIVENAKSSDPEVQLNAIQQARSALTPFVALPRLYRRFPSLAGSCCRPTEIRP